MPLSYQSSARVRGRGQSRCERLGSRASRLVPSCRRGAATRRRTRRPAGPMHNRMAVILAALIAGLSLACAIDSNSGPGRDGGISLQRELSSPAAVSLPFTAKVGGPHDVILEFAWPITDPQVEQVVTNAAWTTGLSGAPTFDFAWQLLKEGAIVAQRGGPQRSTGVVEGRTSGLGSGPTTSLGLAFGGFELTAGAQYALRVSPGLGPRPHASAEAPGCRGARDHYSERSSMNAGIRRTVLQELG